MRACARGRKRTIRRLLIIGGSSVVRQASHKGAPEGSWLEGMLARKPRMLVSVALANKMARTVWAQLVGPEDMVLDVGDGDQVVAVEGHAAGRELLDAGDGAGVVEVDEGVDDVDPEVDLTDRLVAGVGDVEGAVGGVEGERARAVEAGLAAAGVDDAGGARGAGEDLVGGGGDGHEQSPIDILPKRRAAQDESVFFVEVLTAAGFSDEQIEALL